MDNNEKALPLDQVLVEFKQQLQIAEDYPIHNQLALAQESTDQFLKVL